MQPGSVAWRIGSESLLLLGGGRALILQVAHPAVAAGVAQHSDFRSSPWRRLYRTLELTTAVVFGDGPSSRRAAEALRRVHSRVEGEDDSGRPYRALDPELLLWVHATLIETSVLIHDRYVRRLSAAERGLYYEQMLPVAEAYGIPASVQPQDWGQFQRYFEAMLADRLRVTEATREVAASVLHPDLPGLARPPLWPAIEALRLVTVGTLPPRLRAELGLDWGPRRERLLGASEATIRRLLPLLPSPLRRFPAARGALSTT